MRAASFLLRAPRGADGRRERRFVRSGRAWTIELDQIGPIRAVLRDATRWFCRVWQYEPDAGQVFGTRTGLIVRRADGLLHLQAERWCATAPATGHLELPYTDLAVLRQRLQEQQQALRRAERREAAAHGIHTYR